MNKNNNKSKSSIDKEDKLEVKDSKDSKVADAATKSEIPSDIKDSGGIADLNAKAADFVSAGKSDVSKDGYDHKDKDRNSGSKDRKHSTDRHEKHDFHRKGNDQRDKVPSKFAKKPDVVGKVEVAPKPCGNLGDVIPTRDDRAVDEYTEPDDKALALFGLTQASSGLNWQLENDIARILRNNNYSIYVGRDALNNQLVDKLYKLAWKVNPVKIGSSKGDSTAVAIGYVSQAQRLRELNTGIVNYVLRNKNLDTEEHKMQGVVNSFYPYSSLPQNLTMSSPFLPAQIDDIQLFSLDGGAFPKSSNRFAYANCTDHLWTLDTPPYLAIGVPGFNHYYSQADITTGNLSANHIDVRTYVNRQYIYDGDDFSIHPHTIHDVTTVFPNILNAEGSVVHYRHGPWTINEVFNPLQDVNVVVDYNNYAAAPDYNYSVMYNDFRKMFQLHRAKSITVIGDTEAGPLAGITDEQAFDYAVQSGIHFATFMRCLLYAFTKTWSNLPFTKSKLGQVCYNDILPWSVNLARFESMQVFLNTVAKEALPFLPYNKYSYENFKVWFDNTMLDKSKDAFDENNPVMSIRAIFCGLSDFMTISTPLSHDTAVHAWDHYWPRDYVASVLTQFRQDLAQDIVRSHVDNVWGYRVKSNIMQQPMFVPHGDALANFFTYFNCLFRARPWTNDRDFRLHYDTGESLTAMLDPMNFTGFAANFFVHPMFNTQASEWVRDYMRLVKGFYAYIKGLGSNGSIYFDDHVEYVPMSWSESATVPTYKQHIIDYFQNTPRMQMFTLRRPTDNLANLTADDNATYITGGRPVQGYTAYQNADDHVDCLPRLGLPMPVNNGYFDFATLGTRLYNVSQFWATFARPRGLSLLNEAEAQFDPFIASLFYHDRGGSYLSARDIGQPWDLYERCWYPSWWHMPYYVHGGVTLTPCYEYPLTANDNGAQAPDEVATRIFTGATDYRTDNAGPDDRVAAQVNMAAETFLPLRDMKNFAYNYVDSRITQDLLGQGYAPEYREIYWTTNYMHVADDTGGIDDLVATPIEVAASCLRVSYGSGNTALVLPEQWVVPNITGWSANNALGTRQNTVSIMTAYNARCGGFMTSRANATDGHTVLIGASNVLLYRDRISDMFNKSIGLTYQPFLGQGVRAALFYDQLTSSIPQIAWRYLTCDVDMSIKYYNLYANINKLLSGQFDGEAYPSSDGWGVDQLSHPDKVFEDKSVQVRQDEMLKTAEQRVFDK